MESKWICQRLKPLRQRFWERVDTTGGPNACWPWLGSRFKQGYGQFSIGGKSAVAHRVAYELSNGRLFPGIIVRHSCDNPPCCNPAHLLPGTQKDNSLDAIKRGRHNLGDAHPRAKLTSGLVQEIRRSISAGEKCCRDWSDALGITYITIVKAANGQNWSHLPNPVDLAHAPRLRHAKGECVNTAKLTEEQVAEIREDLAENGRYYGQAVKLAKKYGVAAPTICRVLNGRTWT